MQLREIVMYLLISFVCFAPWPLISISFMHIALEKFILVFSNLHYIHGFTPKCVTSGGAHLRGLSPGYTALKKRRIGSEPLAVLCPI